MSKESHPVRTNLFKNKIKRSSWVFDLQGTSSDPQNPKAVPSPRGATPCSEVIATPAPRPRRGLDLPATLRARPRSAALTAQRSSPPGPSLSPRAKGSDGSPHGAGNPRRGKAERAPGFAAAPGAEPIPACRCFPARRGQHRNIHRHPPHHPPLSPDRPGTPGAAPARDRYVTTWLPWDGDKQVLRCYFDETLAFLSSLFCTAHRGGRKPDGNLASPPPQGG